MRSAQRRALLRKRPRTSRIGDGLLLAVALLAGLLSAVPLVEDALSAAHASQVISTLTGATDETNDVRRLELLRQAQAYNAALGGEEFRLDNTGLHGSNGGEGDVVETDARPTGELAPYERQLSQNGRDAMGWIDIPSIGVRQPLRHGTDDDTLAAGVGHLEWSSLPVGGVPSHCVIAGHSGMTASRMFDDLEQVETGDLVVLHVLGDAYQYEVCDIEVVLPEEVQDRCVIEPGEDLCTLMTCTPYGINSHRLLVRARRCPYAPTTDEERAAPVMRPPDRRSAPPLALAGALVLAAVARIGSPLLRRRHGSAEPSTA